MASVGKRTSVYLSDDLAAAVEASGVPLAELIRRGLTGGAAPSVTRPETPGEVRAKVATAREAVELGRVTAAERRQAPAQPRRPAHSPTGRCGVCRPK
jgi:hypothetical protein